MKKVKIINFLEEDRSEEKLFKCTIIILIYLVSFQSYRLINEIMTLQEEVKQIKNISQEETIKVSNIENVNITLMKDIDKIYKLLGNSNIERLYMDNNMVNIEGKCTDLKILDDLKEMEHINNLSVNSIEKKGKKYSFQAMYEIGG